MTKQAKKKSYIKLYGSDDYRTKKFCFLFDKTIFFLDTVYNFLLCYIIVFIGRKMMQWSFYLCDRFYVRGEE